MRFIDLDLLELSLTGEWEKRARKAYEYVKSLPANERADAIDRYNDVWKALKEDLKKLSYGKCWYCESSAHRIIGDVDHFRPKSKVAECSDHLGYWWLAFEWRNFRYTCERCNRLSRDVATGFVGGKYTHFPIPDTAKRVYEECDLEDLWVEDPLLLDPTIADDTYLLTFDPDGTAIPTYDKEQSLEDYRRAAMSIDLYHLNHTELKRRRQTAICFKVKQLVNVIDRYLTKWQNDRGNTDARSISTRATAQLKRMIDAQEEYSMAARAVLKTFRTSKRQWVDALLTAS